MKPIQRFLVGLLATSLVACESDGFDDPVGSTALSLGTTPLQTREVVCEGDVIVSDTSRPGRMCTRIEGDLLITGSANAIVWLRELREIGGSLTVRQTDSLRDLSALSGLRSVGGDVSIMQNAALESLTGLDLLETIPGDLYIGYNDALADVEGLGSVTRVEGDVAIEYTAIASVAGLRSIESTTHLTIRSNPNLSNFEGLEQLRRVLERIVVNSNGSLRDITALAIESVGSVEFYGNEVLPTQQIYDELIDPLSLSDEWISGNG